jgi:ABC-type glycerol-3-phosphate transport system substrate-binding protein/predicted small secreted protein
MKKILTVAVLALSAFILAACVTIANTAPVLTGVGFDATGYKEVTIQSGDAFNPLDDVSAFDDRDGDLTESIEVTGWDAETNSTPGTHTIVLRVEDKEELFASLTILLTVESEDLPPIFENVDLNQTYFIGSGAWSPLTSVIAWEDSSKTVDITDQIEVRDIEGVHYRLDTPGVYNVRLRITNAAGVQANLTIRLTVVRPDIPINLPTTPVNVEMWHAMGNDITLWIRNQATAFRNHYATLGHDFTVTVQTGTGNYDTLKTQVINAILERKLPNIVQGYPDHVAEYLNGGAIANLTPYINHGTYGLVGPDALNDIVSSYRAENSQYDAAGTFYSLPFNKSTEILVYNKEALAYAGITDEADIPTTWQDWFALSDQLIAYGKSKNPTQQGLVKAGSYDSNGNGFITFTRQFGGAYTAINFSNFRGQYLWVNNAQTTAAMQFVKDHNDIFVTPDFWDQQYATTPFALKQVAFAISSSAGARHTQTAINNLPAADRFEFGVAPIPYNKDMPENRAVIQQGTNISLVNSGTPEQRLVSWLFMKWLMSTDVTVDFAIETGYLPVRYSGYETARYQQFIDRTLPGMSSIQRSNALSAGAAYAQSAYFFYDPAFVGSSKARTEVGIAFQRIVTGDGNIAAALQSAYDEATLGQSQ